MKSWAKKAHRQDQYNHRDRIRVSPRNWKQHCERIKYRLQRATAAWIGLIAKDVREPNQFMQKLLAVPYVPAKSLMSYDDCLCCNGSGWNSKGQQCKLCEYRFNHFRSL